MSKGKGQKTRRLNINFRQTKSERSATQSYRDFGKVLRNTFRKIVPGK